DLVRVVQYAALYQIFRQFQLVPHGQAPDHQMQISPVLKIESRRVVNWILLPTANRRTAAVFGPDGERLAVTWGKVAALRGMIFEWQRQMGNASLDRLVDILANRNAALRESFERQENPDKELISLAIHIQELSQELQALIPLDIRSIEERYRQEQ